MAVLPFAASPVPGGLTVPGPTQGSMYEAPPDPAYAAAAQIWGNLSDRIGALADKAAQQEGTRAGKIAALDPNFQPPQTAQLTTYGTAFQQSAVTGYVNKLDQTQRDTQQQVVNDFQKLPQDQQTPQELQKRLDAAKQQLIAQHVIPEAQGAFSNTWDTTARSNVQQAKKDNDAYVQSDAKASAASNILSSQSQMARTAATPGPASDQAMAAQEADFNTRIDGLIADGTYTPVQGAKIKDAQHQSNLQGKVTAQINALPPGDRPAFLKQLQDDWAAGAGGGIPAGAAIAVPGYTGKFTRQQAEDAADDDEKTPSTDDWDKAAAKASPDGKGAKLTAGWSADTFQSVVGATQTQIRQDASQAKQQSSLDVKAINDVTDTINSGIAVPPAQLAAINTKYATSTDPNTVGALSLMNKTQALQKSMQGKSPAQLAVEADNTTQQMQKTGATPDQLALLKTQQDYTTQLRKDLASDPLGRAVRDGMVGPIQPLDFSDPTKFAATLQTRMPTAQHVGQVYQQDPTYFTPDEATQLKTIATQGGPKATQFAQAIAAVGKSQTGAILQEAGAVAPGLAHIGKLAAMNGDPQFMADANEEQRLSNLPDSKQAVPRLDGAAANDRLTQDYGTAFQAMPEFRAGAATTARQAYEMQMTRSTDLGQSPKLDSGAATTAFDKTAQQAAGATYKGNVQYGGVADFKAGWFGAAQKVPIPPNMKASEFTNVIRSLDDKTLQGLPNPPTGGDGHPVTASQIAGAHLVAQSHGRYQVFLGDPNSRDPQQVVTPSGQPFVLDLGQLEGQLRYKMPGAYR